MKYYTKIIHEDNLLKDKMIRKGITFKQLAQKLRAKSTGAIERAINDRTVISEKEYLRIKEAILSL